ncbi:hypothetical protein [Streptomyces zaomyceticus]|uniref:hypothetical protein n=1 Tax=Streptomyces zaomyceticus TaxID=68286 RepID=UPI0034294B1A
MVDRAGRFHLGYPWPNLTLCEVADRLPELMMQSTAEIAVHPEYLSCETPDRLSGQVVHRQWPRPGQADHFMVLIFLGRINIATIFVRNPSG